MILEAGLSGMDMNGPPEDDLEPQLQVLFTLWPDSSMPLVGVLFFIVLSLAAESAAGGAVVVIILYNIRRGGHLCHQVLVLGIAIY
jgi:hypothetical protein